MAETISIEGKEVDVRNKLNDLSSKEWIQKTKSYFYQRGLGKNSSEAQYEKLHPAPYSFTDVSNLIRFFTKRGGKVLDPFVGIGSTIKACLEIERDGYGVELSKKWCELTQKRLREESEFEIDNNNLICGDSRNLDEFFPKNYFDFVVTSPPYWNILNKKDHKANKRVENGQATKYSERHDDLGNIANYSDFLDELSSILLSCYNLLKPQKYMCVVVSDFRHKSKFFPFHADLMNQLIDEEKKQHFGLKGVKVMIQNAKNLFPYGYPYAYVENIHHQYVLVLQKEK